MPDESLMAAWRAAEAVTGTEAPAAEVVEAAPATEAAETETETPEAEAKSDPKTEKVETPKAKEVAATGDAAELEQLKALATKLNYKLEDGRVTVGERAALRAEKREAKARIAALEADLGQKVQQAREGLKGFVAAKEAWEAGDIDGFAKALGGYADWNALQKDVINRFADPSYKEIQELKRKDREREEQAKQQQETQRQVEQRRQQMEAVGNYKRALSQEMAGSADPLVKAMADDAMFVDVVHAIQEQHYDSATDSTCTAEEAVELAMKGAKQPFKKELQALYQKLHAAFGGAAVVPTAQAGKRTGKTGATKREAEAPHLTKLGGAGFMDPSDREYWANQLKSSEG